ncbi:hypothetical protein N7451_012499 [Penicillium sp. IBT 35674x]|nr:hypothetical protein N7451_012499 [Penicillium sp. IBT 35674x]
MRSPTETALDALYRPPRNTSSRRIFTTELLTWTPRSQGAGPLGQENHQLSQPPAQPAGTRRRRRASAAPAKRIVPADQFDYKDAKSLPWQKTLTPFSRFVGRPDSVYRVRNGGEDWHGKVKIASRLIKSWL